MKLRHRFLLTCLFFAFRPFSLHAQVFEFIDTTQFLGNDSNVDTALADFDNDGDIDIFCGNDAEDKIWLNDGFGNFTDSGQRLGRVSDFARSARAGDFDNDGDIDIFVANREEETTWFNDGHGYFSIGQRLGSSYDESAGVALGDVDGDGDIDAIVVNKQFDPVALATLPPNRIWLNNGHGIFSQGAELGQTHAYDVILNDLDNDGDIDAFIANHGASMVWKNNGNGLFYDTGQRLGDKDSRAVASGDIDKDGDIDIALLGFDGFYIWLNNGNGSFSKGLQNFNSIVDTDYITAADVALHDLDKDGDLDIFILGKEGVILLNDGTGHFYDSNQRLRREDGTRYDGKSITLADLDHDGDLDAFLANYYNQPNTVWLNQSKLILTLNPNRSLDDPDLKALFSRFHIQPIPIFDAARGDTALKQDLGMMQVYLLNPSSSADPEVIRQQFLALNAVEDCSYNEHVPFDQSSITPSTSQAAWLPNKIAAPLEAWDISRKTEESTVAVLDNFRGFTQANASQSHGEQVARLADNGDVNFLFVNAASGMNDYATFETLFRALEFAVDEKLAHPESSGMIINLSLSAPLTQLGKTDDEQRRNTALFQRWLKYAALSGVPVVASMGNLNWDVPHYPAAFPETIAVGGADLQNRRWRDAQTGFGSNYGNHLALLAQAQDASGAASGTSFAAARVTNAAATVVRILSEKYPNLSSEQKAERLRWIFKITALDGLGDPAEDAAGRDPFYGFGLLDAEGAAACAASDGLLARPGAVEFNAIKVGDAAEFGLRLTNCSPDDTMTLPASGLTIRNTTANTADMADFTLPGLTQDFVFAPGATQTLTVRFAPKTPGSKSAILKGIPSQKAAIEVPVSGAAIDAEFQGVAVAPEFVNFREVAIGETAEARVTLTNFSAQAVTLQTLVIRDLSMNSGLQASGLSAGQTIAPGASLTVTLTFAPRTPGAKHALLTIAAVEQPETPVDIPICGLANAPGQPWTPPDQYLPYRTPDDPFPVNSRDLTDQADRLMQIGMQLYNNAEFWPALEKFQQAAKLYILAGSDIGEANAQAAAGSTLASVGRFPKALTAYLAAHALYQKTRSRFFEGWMLNKIAMLRSRMGEHLRALNDFHGVLAIERELGLRRDEGRTLMNLGAAYLNLGERQEAQRFLNDALSVAGEVGDIEAQGTALMNLGALDALNGDEQAALNNYFRGLSAYAQIQATDIDQGALWLKIGDVFAAQQEDWRAFDAYQRALAIFQGIAHAQGETQALFVIGKFYQEKGDFSSALDAYGQARRVCGERGDLAEELTVLKQMLTIDAAAGDSFRQAATLTDIGGVYAQMGYANDAHLAFMQALMLHGAAASDWDDAHVAAHSAIGDPDGLSRALLALAEITLRRGEAGKALTLLQTAAQAQDGEENWNGREQYQLLSGEAHWRQGALAAARHFIESAPISGRRSLLLGQILTAQREFSAAQTALRQALQTFAAAQLRDEQGQTQFALSELALKQGQIPQSRDFAQGALLSFRQAGNLRGEADALMRLGSLETRRLEAENFYQEALDLYRELNDRNGQVDALRRLLSFQEGQTDGERAAALRLDLAKAHLSGGEPDAALNELRDALQQLDETASAALRADILLHTGIAYRLKAQFADSLNALRQAQALLPPESLKTGAILLHLGETLFRQAVSGGAADVESAMQMFQQALQMYRQLEDIGGQGTALMRIGDALLRQGRYADAASAYQQAVSLLSQVDDHYHEIVTLMSLGAAYNAQGLYWDALEAYRRALGMMHDTGLFLYSDEYHASRNLRPISETLAPIEPITIEEAQRDIAQTQANLRQAEPLLLDAPQNSPISQEESAPQTPNIDRPTHKKNSADGAAQEKELEKLEEKLAEQQDLGDEAGQEKTVKQIEQLEQEIAESKSAKSESSGLPHASSHSSNSTKTRAAKPRPQRSFTPLAAPAPRLQPAELTREPAIIPPMAAEVSPSSALEFPPLLAMQDAPPNTGFQPLLSEKEDLFERQRRHAQALNMRGLFYLRRGEFQKAGRVFLNAQEIQEEIVDGAGKAETLNNRGLLHYLVGQHDRAESLLTASLVLMRAHHDREGEAVALNHLGLVRYRQGHLKRTQGDDATAEALYGAALGLFRQAREIVRGRDDRRMEGTLLNNIGLTAHELFVLYRACGDDENERQRFASASNFYRKAGEAYQCAARMYADALDRARKAGRRAAASATLHNLGSLYAAAPLAQDALPYFWEAFRLEREARNDLDAARTLSEIGLLYEQEGRARLEQWQTPSASGSFFWESARRLSALTMGDLRLEQAARFYQRALDLRERFRAAARLESLQFTLVEETADAHQQLAMLLMFMNRPEEAFAATERARGRALLDLFGQPRLRAQAEIPPELLAQETALREKLGEWHDALRQQLEISPFSEKITAAQRRIAALEQQYERLETDINLRAPDYAAFTGRSPIDAATAQRCLDDDTALLSYFTTPQATLAFIITKTSLTALTLPVSEDELRRMTVAAVRRLMTPDDVPSDELRGLHQALIAPVAPYLTAKRIGVIPHGVLRYLPFAALTPRSSDAASPRYFSDDRDLFFLPSASVLPHLLRERADESSGTAIVFGYAGIPPLPHAVSEAQAVAQQCGVAPLLGEQATRATFLERASAARLIHLAAHAQLNAEHPLFSAISFADRPLQAQDISALDLRRAELVVLSGCQTSVGVWNRGDDVIALHQAFMRAGASRVVASLWRVEDEATEALMTAFHAHLAQKEPAIAALRQAQQETRARYAHPYYWAAFVLNGLP